MENITTVEVMEKLDMFWARLVKVDVFFCWYMEAIPTEAGMEFTSYEFKGGISIHEIQLALSAPDH